MYLKKGVTQIVTQSLGFSQSAAKADAKLVGGVVVCLIGGSYTPTSLARDMCIHELFVCVDVKDNLLLPLLLRLFTIPSAIVVDFGSIVRRVCPPVFVFVFFFCAAAASSHIRYAIKLLYLWIKL